MEFAVNVRLAENDPPVPPWLEFRAQVEILAPGGFFRREVKGWAF